VQSERVAAVSGGSQGVTRTLLGANSYLRSEVLNKRCVPLTLNHPQTVCLNNCVQPLPVPIQSGPDNPPPTPAPLSWSSPHPISFVPLTHLSWVLELVDVPRLQLRGGAPVQQHSSSTQQVTTLLQPARP
jgi:hypothetical protein